MGIAVGIYHQWRCHDVISFITTPYAEGWERIQSALDCLRKENIPKTAERPLFERVCLLAEGLLLCLPGINLVVHAALRYFAPQGPDTLTQSSLQRQYPAATLYPKFNTFTDSDIVQRHPPVRTAPLSDGRRILFTRGAQKGTEKAVILLRTDKSHPKPACVAMLMLDRGKHPDLTKLEIAGMAAHTAAQQMALKENLLEIRRFRRDSSASMEAQLLQLKLDVESHGPVIVDLWWQTPDNFNHYVIVDEVSHDLQTVRIRDPQHGWDITLKSVSFMSPYLAAGTDIKGLQEILAVPQRVLAV